MAGGPSAQPIGQSGDPGPDSGGPTCGGDAVKTHEGVEAGGCPRQDPGKAEGQEAADAALPFCAAATESHSGHHDASSWSQSRASAACRSWLVAAAGPGGSRPSVRGPWRLSPGPAPGSGPQASCTFQKPLPSSDVGQWAAGTDGAGCPAGEGGDQLPGTSPKNETQLACVSW